MAAVTGNANQVRIGPGKLYAAPWEDATTPPALPDTLSEALDDAFREIGFTTDGSELNYAQTVDGVEVAERVRPIRQITTGVEFTYAFNMAQINPLNLALAMNADPAEAITTGASETTFKFPKAGGEQRCALVWRSDDDLEMLVLSKCFSGGTINIPRRKGTDPAAIGVEFNVEEYADGEDAIYVVDNDLLAVA